MLIAVVNSKGGVGKSTLAVHLSVWLHEQGLRVCVLDSDRQASTHDWLAKAEPAIPVVQHCSAAEIVANAQKLTAQYDVVVADAPAALGAEIASLVTLADLAVMPIGASMLDIWASYRTARLIFKARASSRRQNMPHAFTVLNRVQPRTALARIAAEAVQHYGFPITLRCVQHRTAYPTACGEGTVVWRMGAKARGAAKEMQALFEEMLIVLPDAASANVQVRPPRVAKPADQPTASEQPATTSASDEKSTSPTASPTVTLGKPGAMPKRTVTAVPPKPAATPESTAQQPKADEYTTTVNRGTDWAALVNKSANTEENTAAQQ